MGHRGRKSHLDKEGIYVCVSGISPYGGKMGKKGGSKGLGAASWPHSGLENTQWVVHSLHSHFADEKTEAIKFLLV